MPVTELKTKSTGLVAGKVIADATFSDRDDISATFPLNYKQDYRGKIVFSVIEDEQSDAEEIRQSMSVKQEALAENGNAVDERGEKLKKTAKESAEESKRRSEAQNQGRRPSTVNKAGQTKNPTPGNKNVTLFLPQAITFADGVQYENVDLGAIGGVAAQTAGGALQGDGFIGSLSGGVSGLMGAFSGPTGEGAGRLAANAVSGVFGGAASAGVRATTRVTLNPNTRSLFKAVNLRAFTFTFKMIPLSSEESNEIKKIVKFFRTELYPEHILLGESQDKEGQVPLGYKFPNKILIQMFYNDRPVATKILPSYIESVQTVYNNTSMGIHEDGNFQEVDITINFRESQTLNREDIVQGGY